ncbi:MAG: class I SAM-dependent methyltransferase family protein [Candidatus Caldarchaeales archaeon]
MDTFKFSSSMFKNGLEDKIAVKIEKSKAEVLRRRLKALNIIDEDFKPRFIDGYVYFPIKSREFLDLISDEYVFEVVRERFERRGKKPRSLREALEKTLPRDLHHYIPSSIDLIGHIALIDIPDPLKDYSGEVGRAVMMVYPHVKTVLSKEGGTIGDYRIRSFNMIAGSPITETIYREHGCIYKLDLGKVFFNPRMSGERLRIALEVKDGEYVLDMFAGIGPFSILIAKKNPSARVVAVELNPEAYRYLVENIYLNKVSERVEAVRGDVREVLRAHGGVFDRVIMDLPFRALEFLDLALNNVKKYGIIHLYHVEEGENAIDKASVKTVRIAEKMNIRLEVAYSRRVLEVAPRRFIIALDLLRRE